MLVPSLPAARRRRRALTDLGAVALLVGAAVGAWAAAPVPLAIASAVVAAAAAVRSPTLLVVGVALLAASLGARAWDGLDPPAPAPFAGRVTLLGDPRPGDFGAVRVDVGVGGRRVELLATGDAAEVVGDLLTGERVEVAGRLAPVPEAVRDRLARRHVAGRLTADRAGGTQPATAVHRLANGLRRTLATGAGPLGDQRPLYLGMLVGDDRGQSALVADDFRASGLTHLLAVSGQNVAFVLVLAGPLLSRLGLRSRWVVTLAVIGLFALVTRFEPSVLRASAMAAIACTAGGLGRSVSRVRVLCLAATGVLLVDPFLVRSIGFLLSVGASAGIILLARPIAERVPGPRWSAELVGVTLAAQLGVAPVLIPVFGGIPLASLPANLLAVPAAGPLMVWGLTGGMVAGVLGPPFDGWLQLPSSWLVGWVASVARWGARAPVGTLEAAGATALAVVGALAVVATRWRPAASRVVGIVGAVGVVGVLVAPVLAPPGDLAGVDDGAGAVLWRAGGAVVVVLDDPWVPGVLRQLREADVGRIDVLVVRRGGRTVAGSVLELRSRVSVRLVLADDGHRVRDAVVPPEGAFQVGGLTLRVDEVAPDLVVDVRASDERGPPDAGSGRR